MIELQVWDYSVSRWTAIQKGRGVSDYKVSSNEGAVLAKCHVLSICLFPYGTYVMSLWALRFTLSRTCPISRQCKHWDAPSSSPVHQLICSEKTIHFTYKSRGLGFEKVEKNGIISRFFFWRTNAGVRKGDSKTSSLHARFRTLCELDSSDY